VPAYDAGMSEHPTVVDTPYAGLGPEVVLDALDAVGLRGDGRLIQLNSYENRVFQVFLEDGRVVVAKFYRPLRWSDEAIREEHAFVAVLAEREIPVVPALRCGDGDSLHEFGGYRFAVYPRCPGRAPELEDPESLRWIGRFIGRIHAVGAVEPFAAYFALGDVPINKMARVLEQNRPLSYVHGTGDFAALAKLGQVIRPPGQSALLGETSLPIVRNAMDLAHGIAYPMIQSRGMQNYLTGSLPGQRLLRDLPGGPEAMDSLLRAAGLMVLDKENLR